ncbi:MAG TPA: glutathione binding-like protein [Steroidobacteraceae bacterium]|jgi:glutathione S-transferase
MKLYYFPGACSLADHIVLEWIGAQYETVQMDHSSIKSPDYLTLNANGTVPLLMDGDLLLDQNAAILCHLTDLYPQAHLIGDNTPRGRAEVMRWLSYLNSDVHPAFKPIFSPTRFLPDEAFSGMIADTARNNVRGHLRHLDARLEGRDWLVEQRSIADPYLFVMLRWAVRLGIGLEAFKNLSRFLQRMYADPGVHAAILAEEGAVADSSIRS